MAVVFKGEVEVMLNRHRFLGDGISIHFPDCIIFSNTSGKYSLQFGLAGKERTIEEQKDGQGRWTPSTLLGTDYESISDAYLVAQAHLGKLELKDDMYVPKEKK